MVQGWLGAGGFVALHQQGIVRHRFQTLARAQPAIPVVADGHMAHFLGEDDVQNGHGRQRVACTHAAQLALDQRCGIQAARLQRARHQGHACGDVVRGFLAHAPQALVCRKVAVIVAQLLAQVVAQQAKVPGLLGGHAQPVQIELLGHVGKAPDGVQRQVDGVEFDMGDGVDQHGTPFGRGGRAAFHRGVVAQLGACRPAGQGLYVGRREVGLFCY